MVGANGVLQPIELGDGAVRLTVHQLADVVVELHKLAFAQAAAAVREAVEQLGGGNNAARSEGDSTPAVCDDPAGSDHSPEGRPRRGVGDYSRSGSDTDTDTGFGSDSGFGSSSGSGTGSGLNPRSGPSPGPHPRLETSSGPRPGRASPSGSASESDAAQDESMAHVIQPFAKPDDDDDLYFTATPEPPPPRRTPRPVEVAATNGADVHRIPLVPKSFRSDEDRRAVNRPTEATHAVGEPAPLPEWLEPQLPEFGSEELHPLYDHWDDWDVGRR